MEKLSETEKIIRKAFAKIRKAYLEGRGTRLTHEECEAIELDPGIGAATIFCSDEG